MTDEVNMAARNIKPGWNITRPKRDVRRTEYLYLRLTMEEYALISDAAVLDEMPVRDWCREKLAEAARRELPESTPRE